MIFGAPLWTTQKRGRVWRPTQSRVIVGRDGVVVVWRSQQHKHWQCAYQGWSDGLELITWTCGIRSVLWTVTDSHWRRFYFRSTSVFSALEVCYENALYKFTFYITFTLQTVTHQSSNPAVHGRELSSQPVDYKSDALTTTSPTPSHLGAFSLQFNKLVFVLNV